MYTALMPVDPKTKKPTVAKPRQNNGRAAGQGGDFNGKPGGRYKKGRKFTGMTNPKTQQKGFKRGEIDPTAPKTPEERRNGNGPICGAKRSGKSSSGPGICCQPAGWGTPHVGIGHCKHHGGNTPAQVKAANIEQAERTVVMFGAQKDIHPQVALLEEVQRTAGHVDWLRDYIQQFDDPAFLRQVTESGMVPSVWIQMYQDERAHLLKACAEAIKCGVAERQVRIAEEQGRLMAMVLMAFIHDPDLSMDAKQMALAPKLIRKHLMGMPAAIESAEMPDVIRQATETEKDKTVIDV